MHCGDHSYEIGGHLFGRTYFKHAYSQNGVYAYEQYSVNFPEILLALAVVYYAPGFVSVAAPVGAALAG